MTTIQIQRSKAHAAQGDVFKLAPVAIGCAVLLMSVSSAYAQDATLSTVTVTGIRKGIEDAIDVKRQSTSIVEVVSAEDIGKLPDSSIAESIARLPGLTAQRVSGRDQGINIRGMSGDFSTTLMNGREQVSTGDNRGVEYDQYPSELVGQVVIYKTPDGTLIGQGLSGTVDILTVRPLSFGGRQIGANIRKEQTGVGTAYTGTGDRYNFSYIDQFADKTIGLALGFARYKTQGTSARNETYDTSSGTSYNGSDIKANNGFKLFTDNASEQRDGAFAVVEFKPNKDIHSTLDVYYSKFDRDVVRRGLEIQVNDSWKGAGNFQNPGIAPGAVVTDGRLMSGTWQNVNPLSRTIWEPRRDELKSIGWNNKFKLAQDWTGNVDISQSSATRLERISEMEAGVWDSVNNRPLPGTVTVNNYNQISALQYDQGNPAIMRLTGAEGWGQAGYDKVTTTEDKINAFRLSAQKEMDGAFSKIDFGINNAHRTKTKSTAESKLQVPGGVYMGGMALPAGTSTLSNVGGSTLNTIAFDPSAAFPSMYKIEPNVNGDILQKGWSVDEKVLAAFAKADIETTFMGMPMTGNLGMQAINTDQSSTAPAIDNANQQNYTMVTVGKKFTDVLPSLNLRLDLGGDQAVRVGAAKVMARARMDQLSAWQRTSIDAGKWSGNGGNPNLDPFRATALDLSYEKYFGKKKGYVSIAAFYKNLDTYIFDYTDPNFDFKNLPDLKASPGTVLPISTIGKFSQPRNGSGGSISGIEFAVSVPFAMMSPALDGFGLQANIAKTNSEIKPFGDGDTRPLPGLSKDTNSITAYFEKYGFQTRITRRSRSDFLGEIQGFGANRETKYIRGESIMDAQIGYEFQSGPLKNLAILYQVKNLNKQKYEEYDGTTGVTTNSSDYGSATYVGITYKY